MVLARQFFYILPTNAEPTSLGLALIIVMDLLLHQLLVAAPRRALFAAAWYCPLLLTPRTSDWIMVLGGFLRVALPYECVACGPHAAIAGEWQLRRLRLSVR